jgi:hypothetical protein
VNLGAALRKERHERPGEIADELLHVGAGLERVFCEQFVAHGGFDAG